MKHRSISPRSALALLVGLVATLGLTGCHTPLYYYTQSQYANRTIPPSGLQQRVLASFTANGSTGGAEILDGLRDLRSNVQNTKPTFAISGLTVSDPITILNFPEEQYGYIFDYTSGSLTGMNYAKESSAGGDGTFGAEAPSVAASPDGTRFIGATATVGQILITAPGGSGLALNLPNVDKVVMNAGNTIMLAMTRNSGTTPNTLYRVVQIPQGTATPAVYVDCEPLINPLYCVVPVTGTFDRPTNAYFSLDGNSVYVLNSGPEYGGNTASVAVLSTSALLVSNLATAPSPFETLPVANPVPIPGGVTEALSDGTTLYLAGQSRTADGLFTGNLTLLNQTTYLPGAPVSISDGTHTQILFADDNTLWIGSTGCATGERAKLGENYNCLTMVTLGAATPTATIVPALTPGGPTTVPYPNTNGNLYYYGDLTGLCWVQTFHKVYTAYGGQIHAFYTGGAITNNYDPANGTTPAAGSEINNTNITVQGTVLDVAYMDALTNSAN